MNLISRLKGKVRRWVSPPLHLPECNVPFYFLGTPYGGWPLLKSTKQGATIFSFGLGEDISFDLAAIDKFDARVFGFDPTPRSAAWVNSQRLPTNFEFYQVGIADFDGAADFFAPENDAHVSFSATTTDESKQSIKAEVLRLSTIAERFDVEVPDVVKMDIEGFEYGVIEDIVHNSSIRPQQLLVEFHHDMYGIERSKTLQSVDLIRQAGYQLYFVSDIGREYAFLRMQ